MKKVEVYTYAKTNLQFSGNTRNYGGYMLRFRVKYAPLILLCFVIGLHILGYCLQQKFFSHSPLYVWAIVTIVDTAIAVKCGCLIRNFHKSMYSDMLTEVPNKGYFYFVVRDEMKNMKKGKSHISLLIIDMDHLKHINDTYGHLIGDALIKQMSSLLLKNTRPSDILVRWGGDEFFLLLPGTNSLDAYTIAERIRKTIEGSLFICKGIKIKTTVSIGVSSVEDLTSIDKFIDIADKALYRAKENRNSVAM